MLRNKLFITATVCATVLVVQADPSKDMTVAKRADKQLKVEYVDSLAAMRDSKAGQMVSAELESDRQKMAGELQKMEKQFSAALKEAQEKSAAMSDEMRDREQARLAKMERDFKIRAQECEQELKTKMQRATEKLSKDLDDAVYQRARAEDLDVVIDKMTGRVIYSRVDQEPTERVVALMDKNHEARVALEGKKTQPTTVAKADKKTSNA